MIRNGKVFGQRVKVARDFRGVSQGELAKAIKASTSSISLIESGKRDPSLKVAVRIAKVLGTKVGWLLNE